MRKNILLLIVFLVFAFAVVACSPAPEVQLLRSFQELEWIMRTNVDNPDSLIQKLNEYNESHRESWKEIHHTFNNMTDRQQHLAIDQQQADLRKTLINIVNLDLEIQDRLANDPALLEKYTDAVRNIGLTE